MPGHRVHVRIDGEPFLSRARSYRKQYEASLDAWMEFAQRYGATAVSGSLHGLQFDEGGQPEGWTVAGPKSRYFSRPKKGHADCAVLAEMRSTHPMPKDSDVFGNALCYNLSYEAIDGSCHGSGGIGYLFGNNIGWFGDTFYAVVPDAEAAVRDHLAAYPDHRIKNEAATWRMPEGLTRITEAEYKLASAQHDVEMERSPLPAAQGGR